MSGYLARLVARTIPAASAPPLLRALPGAPRGNSPAIEDPFEAAVVDSPSVTSAPRAAKRPAGERPVPGPESAAPVAGDVPARAGPLELSSQLATSKSEPAPRGAAQTLPTSGPSPTRPEVRHDQVEQLARSAEDRDGEDSRGTPSAAAEAGGKTAPRSPAVPTPAEEEAEANALAIADHFMARVMRQRAGLPRVAPHIGVPPKGSDVPERAPRARAPVEGSKVPDVAALPSSPGEMSERPDQAPREVTPRRPTSTAAFSPTADGDAPARPTLVVGRIDVEVVAPSAPSPPTAQVVVYVPPRPASPGPPSTLRFGLGQV